MPQTLPYRSRLVAALMQRCPRCREGRVFRGHIAMNETCPRCGLRFEREQGYFLGAMYFSYPLSVPIVGLLILIGHFLFPDLRIELVILVAAIAYLPFFPLVYRYSRVFWIYFERWANPTW
jgi:uncharacterized protein (DUF983 family)